MLAIQPSRMESGQPPLDAGNAFGYITDHGFGFAPPPPHHESFDASAALLSKQEISSMDGFFGSFVDPSSYEFTFSVNDVHLPNQFVGMATSFGTNSLNLDDTQPPHFEPYHIPQPDRAPPPPPPPHALHYPMAPSFDQHHMSGEMLAAAQYLQEGSMLRAAPPQPPANFARLPSTHLRYQPMDDFRQEERRNMRAFDSVNHSNTFTDMFFGAPRPQGPRPTIPMTLQYGSDSRFVDTQPYPAPERESSEVIEREKMRHLQCFDDLHPANGAPGPSNPVIHTNGTLSPGRLKPHPPLPPNHHEDEDEDEYEASTPKGRKGKTVARRSSEEDDDDDDDGSTPPARASKGKSRKRKPKGGDAAPGTNSPATSDGPSKRRKSNANGAPSKLPRENLTDAQKRENHIKSEQKRRGVIKDGYDGLVEAVPGLRGSGYSKAVILASAGDYLERLLEGNEQLRQQLASLGGEL